MRWPKCPNCNLPLISKSTTTGRVWTCWQCGSLFSREELDRLELWEDEREDEAPKP